MSKYQRDFRELCLTKHPGHSQHSNLGLKMVLIGLMLVVGTFLLWKATTYDYCPFWYGSECFPSTNWKQTINSGVGKTPQIGTGTMIQNATGLQ